MDKVVTATVEALAGVTDGVPLAVGRFGLCGVPEILIRGLRMAWATGLAAIGGTVADGLAGPGTRLQAARDQLRDPDRDRQRRPLSSMLID